MSKISEGVKKAWKKGCYSNSTFGKPKKQLVWSEIKSVNWKRQAVFEAKGRKCEKCGWSKTNPNSGKIPVEINHKNGNNKDWSPENVEILCPNCHSLTPKYKFHGQKH